MTVFIALFSGVVFGAGLLISGMMDPEKVVGFLDLFGDWDPSLMFVMGSALIVTIPAFRLVFRRNSPLFDDRFTLPLKTHLDKSLVAGAAIFGIGWGLYGYCPGPAIASLSTLSQPGFLFVPSMLVGMFVANWVSAK